MLRIHTGLHNCSKTNIFDLHLNKTNPFGIHESCIKIAKNELFLEQYIMALNRYKYDIKVQNYDAIKRDQIFFGFMQQKLNCMYGLYTHKIFLLVYTIKEDQSRKKSAAEIEKSEQRKKPQKKIKECTLSLLPKKSVL